MVDDQTRFNEKLSALLANYASEVEKNTLLTIKTYLFESGKINELTDQATISDATQALIATSFDIYARTNCDSETKLILKNNFIKIIGEALHPVKGQEYVMRNNMEESR